MLEPRSDNRHISGLDRFSGLGVKREHYEALAFAAYLPVRNSRVIEQSANFVIRRPDESRPAMGAFENNLVLLEDYCGGFGFPGHDCFPQGVSLSQGAFRIKHFLNHWPTYGQDPDPGYSKAISHRPALREDNRTHP